MEMSVACHAECRDLASQSGKAKAPKAPKAPKVVNVGDREADIYELLCEAQHHKEQGVHLLVRSQHNRKLQEDEQEGKEEEKQAGQPRVWDMLAGEKARGKVTLEIPRSKGMARRKAVCEVRYKEVTLAVPEHKAKYTGAKEPITLCAIKLKEISSEAGESTDSPIHWKLLTTWPVTTPEEALRVVKWYSHRWHIEVYFRVLKTGCRVEKRQLRSIETLWPMIALDMITASYVMGLTSRARAHPMAPATEFFSTGELEALNMFWEMKMDTPEKLPLEQAVKLVAKLGGHLGRKGDGPPGAEVLWRGITKLRHISEAWEVFAKLQRYG